MSFRRRDSYYSINPPILKECKKCHYCVPMKKNKSYRKSCQIHSVIGKNNKCGDCDQPWNTENKCYHVAEKWYMMDCCVIL